MKVASPNHMIRKAQELEQQGRVTEALQCLLEVGAIDWSIKLLVRHKRFIEAARLRLQSFGVPLHQIATLPDNQQHLALEAAHHLEQANEWARSADIYLRVNRPDRADAVFQRAIFSFSKMHRQHPKYREACLRLLQLACTIDRVTFELDHILRSFIQTGPQTPREATFFYQLGKLYLRNQQYESAEQVLQILNTYSPSFRDVPQLLTSIYEQKQQSPSTFQRILEQEQGYRDQGHQHLPMLDDYPMLPDLPHAPSAYTPPPSSTPTPSPQVPDSMFPMLSAQMRQKSPIPSNSPIPPSQHPQSGYPIQPPPSQHPNTPPSRHPGAPMPKGPTKDLHSSYRRSSPPPPSYSPIPPSYPPTPTNDIESPTQTDLPHAMEADLNLNIIDPASQTDLSVEAQTHASYHSMPAALEGDFLTHFAPGSVIDGRYNIVQQVGQGGMAAVFRAIDEQLDEEVALKVFDPFYSNDKTFLRFKRELKLSRKLSHPNIIRLHDIGSHQQFHYISMELLEGRDLEDILSMHKGVDIVFGTQILLQICSGLQAAHDIGVIHRDIKPSNFFLTDEGVLKVMDFGIAIEANSDKLTATGSVVGTGMYMAPERAMGQELISPESDLYSIGIVAFEMFTGKLPFYHENIIPLLMMHVHDTPPRPSQINPHVPLLLESIILKLLAKSPGDRYDSCRELSDALRGFLRTLPSAPLER